jgi:D-alanyl-D-alanine carboxypeptidase
MGLPVSLRIIAVVAAVAAWIGVGPGRRAGLDAPAVQAMSPAAAAIDQLMTTAYPADQPGAALVVMNANGLVLRKAYGLANLELNVPLTPEHVFALASLSKPFTAAAVLKLSEEGKLRLDEEITKYLPAYPTHGYHVTIEHLLTHTSGLSALSETSDYRATASQESPLVDVLDDWIKDLPPDFAPGERWAYSNWGYNLLGAIIERASGMSYQDYLAQRLFAPAGMTHTAYNDRRRIIPMRATGYDQIDDRIVNLAPVRSRVFLPGGAAPLVSTVDDLAHWNAAIDANTVLSPASTTRMFTSAKLKNGEETHYGDGWDLGAYAGHRVQEHAGGTFGFLSYMVRLPDDHAFVAILTNRSFAKPPIQATAHRIAALAIGQPIAEPPPVAVSAANLDRLVGTYRGPDVGTFTVTREADALFVTTGAFGKLPLIPTGPLTFRTDLVLWTWTFELDAAGAKAVRARVREWKIDDVAERYEPVRPKPRPVIALAAPRLDACAGTYESLNGILVQVARAGTHLTVTPLGQASTDIFPVSATEFTTKDGGATYRFVAGANGQIVRYLRTVSGGSPVPARRIR